ncbi:IS6 family transposase [Burkholderia vietnamiensis]|uniref:IS6 family transposase n=1 Tax=Burkholderia vietnamiensis TaxID=60552 RepID=UPI00075CECAA|nr:IS6 family transposase [Burkholderia vietnamiensis]KVE99172.1 transposase [Burkholderia vietnamiensis]
MKNLKSLHHGHHFPAPVVSHAVRWYFRFQFSLRDLEELLFERDVIVSHDSICRWNEKFDACFAHCTKTAQRRPGGIWHLDEVFVALRGAPYVQWRAVDQHGAELDILLPKRRDTASANRFFNCVLAACGESSKKNVTDPLRCYSAAQAAIPGLENVKHVFLKARVLASNRAENSHQPTRERECPMRGFRLPERTWMLLSCFGLIRRHSALKRHLPRASLYRKQRAACDQA